GALFWVVYGPARGITFGTATCIILTAILCLQRSGLDVPSQPNQGIVRSGRNALVLGLAIFLIITPVIALSYGLEYGWQTGLENGALAPAGLCAALIFGGIPVFQHWGIRFLCARQGYLPLKLVLFLNAMTEMMLIQRVGGGYRFRHDLVRGFFAGKHLQGAP